MRDLLIQNAKKIKDLRIRRNISREFLHHLILKITYDNGYFQHYTFVGGTALRVVHNLNRFSEDIDLSLSEGKPDFSSFIQQISKILKYYGFETYHQISDRTTVQKSSIKFPGLPLQLGLSRHITENLSVKIEVDTNPPAGFHTQLKLIKKDFIFAVNIMDLSSIFANKLSALLFRKYTKGRDYYDFMWFVTSRTKLNTIVFNNAYEQIHKKRHSFTIHEIKELLKEKFISVKWDSIQKDLSPFLENPEEISFIQKDTFLNLVDEITA